MNIEQERKKPRWKRIPHVILKVYMLLCTVFVTAYFALLFSTNYLTVLFEEDHVTGSVTNYAEGVFGSTDVMAMYGVYMAQEYPQRADWFGGLAQALDTYSRKTDLIRQDLLKILGDPDLIADTPDGQAFVYFHDRSAVSNKWAVYVNLIGDKVARFGYNDATVNDHFKYQPFKRDSQQGAEGDAKDRAP